MAARAGMDELLLELRGLTNAGTADYTVAGVNYFSDDHLQMMLDETRRDWRMVGLVSGSETLDGTAYWHEYSIPSKYGSKWEREDGGTTVWRVYDSTGTVQGTTLYTVDWDGGVIRFAADQGGTAYYLDGRAFNMNRAAAKVYRRKAAYAAAGVDWGTDSHSVKASQEVAHYKEMADLFEMEAGVQAALMIRSDVRVR